MPDLLGKVAVITGASSGIGEDAARAFAAVGCKVALAARRMERLEELAGEIRENGGEALPVKVDVSRQEEIEGLVKAVLGAYGQVDILFNNAGFGRLDWLETLDPQADIEAMLAVNLGGTIHVTRAFLPEMIRQRSGVIINMSSVAGWMGSPLYSVYSATKYGLRGFTEVLRREVKPLGIQVCGIYPGSASSEFSAHAGNSAMRRNIKIPPGLRMSSVYVGRRVVGLAKHPRRMLILPWWMGGAIWLDAHAHWLVDWVVNQAVKRFHG